LLPFGWERFLIIWCGVFHALMAIVLVGAPLEQIRNAGTDPVFSLASREVWAFVFVLCSLGSLLMLHRYHPAVQLATWVMVFSCSAVWFTAFLLAVLQHRGSAVSIIVWPFLYGPWIVAAFRVGLGKR
jgi:hypothetical protein